MRPCMIASLQLLCGSSTNMRPRKIRGTRRTTPLPDGVYAFGEKPTDLPRLSATLGKGENRLDVVLWVRELARLLDALDCADQILRPPFDALRERLGNLPLCFRPVDCEERIHNFETNLELL